MGEVHPRGDEDVVPAVGVEVVDARPPRPIGLHADRVRDLLEAAAAAVREQRVAENELGLPVGKKVRGRRAGIGLAGLGRPVAGRDVDPHVGVHVGDQEVDVPVAVEVEGLDAHRTPGCLGEVFAGRVAKPFSALVEPQVVLTLHVQDVQVGQPVVVHVDHGGVAAPAAVDQADLARHVLEPAATEVVIQDARFGAVRVGMAVERVRQAHVVATRPLFIARVDADVGHEQVDQAIPVVVEEHRAGRMPHVPDAGLRGDVAELAPAEVPE